MTEIQIKNLIKEYEKEYIEFMEIEKLPQYKIDFFEINVEESDAAGFASAAQAYYMILSILVYTLFSRMFDLMQPPAVKHSIAVV